MIKLTHNREDFGFERELFKSMNKLRSGVEQSDYRLVALVMIFLKRVSHIFGVDHVKLLVEHSEEVEDQDAYMAGDIFPTSKRNRWSHLHGSAKHVYVSEHIDDTMRATEKEFLSLVKVKDILLWRLMFGGIQLVEGKKDERLLT